MKDKCVVLVGNPNQGFKAVGPFDDHEQAWSWCCKNCRQALNDTWCATLFVNEVSNRHPLDTNEKADPHILACGDPETGYRYWGIFDNFAHAGDVANHNSTSSAWVMRLIAPNTFAKKGIPVSVFANFCQRSGLKPRQARHLLSLAETACEIQTKWHNGQATEQQADTACNKVANYAKQFGLVTDYRDGLYPRFLKGEDSFTLPD